MKEFENILENKDDIKFLKDVITKADTSVIHNMNQSRVAAEILLASTIAESTESLQKYLHDMGLLIQGALKEHESALNKSAEAANKHAKGLTYATWALVIATLGLLIATIFN